MSEQHRTAVSLVDVHEPVPGLSLHWYAVDGERRIIQYVVTELNQTVLIAWRDHVLEMLQGSSQSGNPFLAIYDLSHRGVGLNYAVRVNYQLPNIGVLPESREQAEGLVQGFNTDGARVALVFNQRYSGNLGKFFATKPKSLHPKVEYATYLDVSAALTWLVNAGGYDVEG